MEIELRIKDSRLLDLEELKRQNRKKLTQLIGPYKVPYSIMLRRLL